MSEEVLQAGQVPLIHRRGEIRFSVASPGGHVASNARGRHDFRLVRCSVDQREGTALS